MHSFFFTLKSYLIFFLSFFSFDSFLCMFFYNSALIFRFLFHIFVYNLHYYLFTILFSISLYVFILIILSCYITISFLFFFSPFLYDLCSNEVFTLKFLPFFFLSVSNFFVVAFDSFSIKWMISNEVLWQLHLFTFSLFSLFLLQLSRLGKPP